MNLKKFNSHTPRNLHFSGFGGVKASGTKDPSYAASVVNFRVREDGALEKRCGSRCLFDLEEEIRGLWSGILNSRFSAYFLAGTTVYRSDLSQDHYVAIGTVDSAAGNANFFCLQGKLYLSDGGTGVYLIEENSIRPAHGYVPLLGKDWDTDLMGKINEPLNLINRHAQITYVVSSSSSIFIQVPKPIATVDAFYHNGVLLSPEDYQINNDLCAIMLATMEKGDRLELFLTFEEEDAEKELLSLFCASKSSTFFCAGEKSRTFFFGSEGSDLMFCTSYVAPDSLERSAQYYETDPLYLPYGYEFRVGDGTSPIRGAIRHYDSLLIFTEKDTWLANADSTGEALLPAVPVNATLGCISPDGCVLSPNDPITLSRHGLYRWKSRDPETTPHDAIRIPAPPDGLLSLDELRESSLFYDALANELWWSIPSQQKVWITSPEKEEWYCFTGFSADRMFDADGSVGFIHGSCVYVMDPSLNYDSDKYQLATKIAASYESVPLHFDSPHKKNLSEIHAVCDLGGATLKVTLTEDSDRSVTRQLKDDKNASRTTLSCRMRSGRFETAKLHLSSADVARLVIHEMTLVVH